MTEPGKELVEEVNRDFVKEGMMCSQVSFAYAAKKLGFDQVTAKHIASAFGGGMLNGERCGTVSGALMGLGLKYGHSGPEDKPNEANLQARKAELEKSTIKIYAYLQRNNRANFGDPEDQKKIQENHLTSGCSLLTSGVCKILDDYSDNYILENGYHFGR